MVASWPGGTVSGSAASTTRSAGPPTWSGVVIRRSADSTSIRSEGVMARVTAEATCSRGWAGTTGASEEPSTTTPAASSEPNRYSQARSTSVSCCSYLARRLVTKLGWVTTLIPALTSASSCSGRHRPKCSMRSSWPSPASRLACTSSTSTACTATGNPTLRAAATRVRTCPRSRSGGMILAGPTRRDPWVSPNRSPANRWTPTMATSRWGRTPAAWRSPSRSNAAASLVWVASVNVTRPTAASSAPSWPTASASSSAESAGMVSGPASNAARLASRTWPVRWCSTRRQGPATASSSSRVGRRASARSVSSIPQARTHAPAAPRPAAPTAVSIPRRRRSNTSGRDRAPDTSTERRLAARESRCRWWSAKAGRTTAPAGSSIAPARSGPPPAPGPA